MTHLPYIVASYAVLAVMAAWFSAAAWARAARARRLLAAIDPRQAR